MLNLVDEFYEHENTFHDSVFSKEKYDRMTSNIRGAFDTLMKDVDATATDIMVLQVDVER